MTRYRITLKNGAVFTTDAKGNILHDGDRNMSFDPSDGHEWRIIGIKRRHHSALTVSLTDAANGADIGQGWIVDVDHGTVRLWAMPTYRRAVKVARERI